MRQTYLPILLILLLLASCGNQENEQKEHNQHSEKQEEKVGDSDTKIENLPDKTESSKIQNNVVYGNFTLNSRQNQDTYDDKKTQTKYILEEDRTIKKIINKSNNILSPKAFMQTDAKKVEQYSDGVYKYYSKSIDKYYKVIEKHKSHKNILIVTMY
ncbi:hypothetical protein [Staphylococcus nepalensis]|uniref:Uncharacterized protein n=1 Tax=Staphylococcus nepalensis TaxID=214473 RepID=A0A380GRC1_9STAP|nr:hypothetical protein [Staphylococcus nepalensis]POA01352.1 hypothetical protein CD130_00200 [Staphylococcus nepalensis]GGB82578.1 hypothetical protein GCM10007203_12270 [Staphylococcus nepalensis]SUM56314.1 Uncharacterised protein [Staphylococcus nepalensis]VDG68290.1 Uncharacterised protein [Lacrimispora indolis]